MNKNALKQLNSYRKVQINTASPLQKVVLVYDGIIRKLEEIVNIFATDDSPKYIERVNNTVQETKRIILELQLAIDMDNGGEVAISLDNQYVFWLEQLHEANVKKDPKFINDILPLVTTLRDTWKTAADEARKLGIG